MTLYRIVGMGSVAVLTMIVVGAVLDEVMPETSGGWQGLVVNLVGAVIFFAAVGFTTTAADNGGFRRTWQAIKDNR